MYKFQGLLNRNEKGNIEGPMSPVLLIKEISKQLDFRVGGLLRVHNTQCDSGYDHLITKTKYKNCSVYRLFIDCGTGALPASMYVSGDDEVTITPIYTKEIDRMPYHRDNVELPKYSRENPIMILSKEEMKTMFIEAEKSEQFKVKA